MGNSMSTNPNITFEDVQSSICEKDKTLIINTLDAYMQGCLIAGTLAIDQEVEVLNAHMKNNIDVRIIIYGMNDTDKTVQKKYEQLIKLGFYNVYIFSGGIFQWLLLQDVYGNELFPTTSLKVDILKYKGRKQLNATLALSHFWKTALFRKVPQNPHFWKSAAKPSGVNIWRNLS